MRNKGINKAERLKKQAQGLAAIPAKRLEAIVQIMRDGKVRRKTAERILPLAAKSMRDEIREFISMDSGAWAVPPERDKRVSGARKSKTCAWNSWGIDLSDFSAERMLR